MYQLKTTDSRVPRWMQLAFPEDAAQTVELAKLVVPVSSKAQDDYLKFELTKLSYEIWRRTGRVHKLKFPHSCRPSKLARITGYRKDH